MTDSVQEAVVYPKQDLTKESQTSKDDDPKQASESVAGTSEEVKTKVETPETADDSKRKIDTIEDQTATAASEPEAKKPKLEGECSETKEESSDIVLAKGGDDGGPDPVPPSTEGTKIFNDSDVLSGRGGGTNVHPGNRQFRDLINMHRRAYLKARKNDKPAISRAIVRTIRENNGRFLKKDEKSGLWFEIGDDAAREKTSQALRQRAPEMRKLLFDTEREEARQVAEEQLRQQRMMMGMPPEGMSGNGVSSSMPAMPPMGPNGTPMFPNPALLAMGNNAAGKNAMPPIGSVAVPEAYTQMFSFFNGGVPGANGAVAPANGGNATAPAGAPTTQAQASAVPTPAGAPAPAGATPVPALAPGAVSVGATSTTPGAVPASVPGAGVALVGVTPNAPGAVPPSVTAPGATSNAPGTVPAIVTALGAGTAPGGVTAHAAGTAQATVTAPGIGAAPATVTAPGIGAAPANLTDPSIGAAPATVTAPGIGAAPATVTAPGIVAAPATVTAPGIGAAPATVTAPGIGAAPATVTAPGIGVTAPSTFPAGASAIPATNVAPSAVPTNVAGSAPYAATAPDSAPGPVGPTNSFAGAVPFPSGGTAVATGSNNESIHPVPPSGTSNQPADAMPKTAGDLPTQYSAPDAPAGVVPTVACTTAPAGTVPLPTGENGNASVGTSTSTVPASTPNESLQNGVGFATEGTIKEVQQGAMSSEGQGSTMATNGTDSEPAVYEGGVTEANHVNTS